MGKFIPKHEEKSFSVHVMDARVAHSTVADGYLKITFKHPTDPTLNLSAITESLAGAEGVAHDSQWRFKS